MSNSKKFYTNGDKLLSDLMKDVLPGTHNLHFLVGFFYFSGFQQLHNEIKDKHLRVLVGMDVEVGIANAVREKFEFGKESLDTRGSEFIYQLKDIFNNTDMFDSQVNQGAMDIFINKIIDGSLEIRKTREPNHAKLYLFERTEEFNEGGSYPGVMITGSSNLSYSGMGGRHEFNYLSRDPNDFEDSKKFFDFLREKESEPITSGGEDDEVVQMLLQETWLQIPSPYYLYVKLLYTLFGTENAIKTPKEITGERYWDLAYQLDAIRAGVKTIEHHGGVIVADVVGLGKSIIGSAIAHNLQRGYEGNNKKVLIIAPPHLVPQRKDYTDEFKIDAEIFSSGKVESAWEYNEKYSDSIGFFMLDEAHKYRNSDTIDYGYIHQIAQGKQVILLTATPFNNSPSDIFNLIKLFQIPGRSTLQTTNNLEYEIQNLQNEYKELRKSQRIGDKTFEEINIHTQQIAQKVKNLIWPVVIRRSRVDLKNIDVYNTDLIKQGYEFAEVSIDALEYNMGNLHDLYTSTLDELIELDDDNLPRHFKGARYKILSMIKGEYMEIYQTTIEETLGYKFDLLKGRQDNMPSFIRRLLVARFESSKKAFLNTLKSLLTSIEHVYQYIEHFDALPVIKKGSLPDLEALLEDEAGFFEEDLESSKLDSVMQYIDSNNGLLIDINHIDPDFFKYLESDKKYLTQLYEDWSKTDHDPKYDSLVRYLQRQLESEPNRKIVIFSSYADTINDLAFKLGKSDIRYLSVTGGTKTEKLKNSIKYNFDAGVDIENQRDDFDILLATDAISEGYNLHRAGTIINYDIPYNPTRVIQRIGRINRINKKMFDKLYVFNYFPTLVGEDIIRSKQISTLKIKLINAILGNDTKTLTDDEELGSFYDQDLIESKGLEGLIKEKLKEQEGDNDISWDTQYINERQNIKKSDPDILKKLEKIPARSRVMRKGKGNTGVLVVAQKGANMIASIYDQSEQEIRILTTNEAINLFRAGISEQGFATNDDFYNQYDKIRDYFKNPPSSKPNAQLNKAIENLRILKDKTGDIFFMDLIGVARVGNLPNTYLKKIRSLNAENIDDIVNYLRKNISKKIVSSMKQEIALYDEQRIDLIMIEQFSN